MAAPSFLRHAAVYGLGTILIQAGGFFLLPLYTAYLSPAEYGVLEILSRMADVLAICLLLGGVRQAVVAFHGQCHDDGERRRVVATLLAVLAVTVLGSVGAVCLTADYWYAWLGISDANLLRLAFTATMMEAAFVLLLAVCQARQESSLYVGITIAQFLVRTSLVIVLVVGCDWGVWGVVTGTVVVSGAAALGLAAREVARGAWRPDWSKARAMLAFSLPLMPAGIGFFILNNGDRFFLLRYAGEDAVGTYALAYKLALAVSLLGRTPFTMVWTARMYEVAKQPDASLVFGRCFTRLIGAYLLVGLALCLFAGEITVLLGGPRYAGVAPLIAPVVLAYLFLTVADLMDAGFYIRRRTWHKSWIVAVSTSTMLLLYALLIPRWHGLGAALATVGGFVVHACLTGLASQRVFPVRYEPTRLAAMLALAIGLWSVSQSLPVGGWAIPARLGLWALWPALLWLGGFVPEEEKQLAGSLLRRGLVLVRPLHKLDTLR
ncbi:MAG: lipopolysaccharide biosynthesis protein [Planctomycetia bacterium]|nr:lipopolysaccharide biosynthesis protein [Planctomycetia bacterium]